MSLFKEKLNKQLFSALKECGIEEPTELQKKCFSKINSGQDLICVSATSIGKTTLTAIASVHKLKYAVEDAPRALILVGTDEKAVELKEKLALFCDGNDLRVRVAHKGIKFDKIAEEVYMGSDIVIGTTPIIFDLYLKFHLNLNKLRLFVLDDADVIVKSGNQGLIDRLVESLPKCQHLVFTKIHNEKIEKLISKFIVAPAFMQFD